jgi:ADP-ribose pyrophosphatase
VMKHGLTEEPIDRETIYMGKIITLHADRVRLPNGNVGTREIVQTRDSVAIVPVTCDGKVVLVRQYRYAAGEEVLEIPAGRIDPG